MLGVSAEERLPVNQTAAWEVDVLHGDPDTFSVAFKNLYDTIGSDNFMKLPGQNPHAS